MGGSTRRAYSLRTAAAGVGALAALGVLASLWILSQRDASKPEIAAAEERNRLLAETLAAQLDLYHDAALGAFALASDAVTGDPSQRPTGLPALLRDLGFTQVCAVDARTGARAAELPGLTAPCAEILPPTELEALRTTLAAEGPGFSPVRNDKTGAPTLYALDRDGERMVFGAVRASALQERAAWTSFGERGVATVVDGDGRVLAHPSNALRTGRRDLSADPAVARALTGESGAATFDGDQTLDGEAMVAGFAVADAAGWAVVVSQPTADLAPKDNAAEWSVVLGAAAGVAAAAALILASVFSTTLVAPLRAATRAVERIADGDAETEGPGDGTAVIPAPPRELALREFAELRSALTRLARSLAETRKEARTARERAEDAVQTQSRFLACMSHELRTPLNAIIGFSDLMRQQTFGDLGSDRYREYAQDINKSASHLLSLINDLLDVSKIRAGEYTLQPEKVDLAEVLEETVMLIGQEAEKKGVDLKIEPESEVTLVEADERAMRQIVINLASNAVRYTPAGGRVRLASTTSPNGRIALTVADTGPGIPADKLDEVMQPFERLEAHKSSAPEGTGLGLSIVKQLVELHGGRFQLKSVVGKGTKAMVFLPRNCAPSIEAHQAAKRREAEDARVAAEDAPATDAARPDLEALAMAELGNDTKWRSADPGGSDGAAA